jgi:protein-histidine pros-kinase
MSESDPSALSPRERQLLKLAAAGHTDSAIANRLGISEATVKTYWRRIRGKIGPYSRTELVAKVLKSEMGKAVSALREEKDRLQREGVVGNNIYRQLLDQAPDAILIVSKAGKIQLANAMAANLFGWKQEELQGRDVSDLIPDRHRNVHGRHMNEFVSSPSKREMGDHLATSAVDSAGHEFPIAASLAAIGEGDEMAVICIVRSLRWKK